MTWGIFTKLMALGAMGWMAVFGPSWYRRWLLVCVAALVATTLIGAAIIWLTMDEVDDGAVAPFSSSPVPGPLSRGTP